MVGPSGSGKSSAVKAGLIPVLREGAIPAQGNIAGSDKWFVAEMVPGSHPLEELEQALWPVAVDPPPSLVEPMRRNTRGLLKTIRRILPDEEGAQLLLLIDQFEELFTLVEEERRDFFVDSLLAAIRYPRSPLQVVITLRADFYDRPLQVPALGRLLKENTEIVLPMSAEELTWAVREPARRMGVGLESGLAEAIVADVSEQPGALPLLQYALTELFTARQERQMTRQAYQEIGGVTGALGRRAEGLYEGLDGPGKEAAQQLFLRLVTLGEGVEDTRRRVLRSELEAISNNQQSTVNSQQSTGNNHQSTMVIANVIDVFGATRLLTFDHDPVSRESTVELAHEALLREWSRLRGWLDENRSDVRMQRILARAAGEWAEAGRDDSYLLRGSRLEQVRRLVRPQLGGDNPRRANVPVRQPGRRRSSPSARRSPPAAGAGNGPNPGRDRTGQGRRAGPGGSRPAPPGGDPGWRPGRRRFCWPSPPSSLPDNPVPMRPRLRKTQPRPRKTRTSPPQARPKPSPETNRRGHSPGRD